MSYLDNGYDKWLEKTIINSQIEYSDMDTDALIGNLSGSKILSTGTIMSQDRKIQLNLDKNMFVVNDGTIDRLKMGKFDDGEYGIRIYDAKGNEIINITGTNNIIQSSDKLMQLDLSAKQFRVYDGRNLRVLLGELV